MDDRATDNTPKLRELYIEELAEVNGGGPEKVKELLEAIRDKLMTTYGPCEEGIDTC